MTPRIYDVMDGRFYYECPGHIENLRDIVLHRINAKTVLVYRRLNNSVTTIEPTPTGFLIDGWLHVFGEELVLDACSLRSGDGVQIGSI